MSVRQVMKDEIVWIGMRISVIVESTQELIHIDAQQCFVTSLFSWPALFSTVTLFAIYDTFDLIHSPIKYLSNNQ